MEQLTRIESMAYEVNEAGDVLIEQDTAGNVDRVYLHPIHVHLLATEMGLMQGDPDAWRRVETLERRLGTLRDRIATLNERLWAQRVYPEGNNANDPDCIYSDASLELAEEFCADLPYIAARHASAETQVEPRANPQRTRTVPNQPELGLDEVPR